MASVAAEARRGVPSRRADAAPLATGRVTQSYGEVTLTGIDLLIRPIQHRVPPRVRAHLFLCLLANLVEGQLRRAWAPLLFGDEEAAARRAARDPLTPVAPAETAQAKRATKKTPDGEAVHSLRTLVEALAPQTRITYEIAGAEAGVGGRFTQVNEPTPWQANVEVKN